MDDATVLERIERLMAQERSLEASHAESEATPEQRRELHDIEVELDQCWDLLRQRRARRAAGLDPDGAQVRPPEVVEDYLQ
jgi:hypothetical protein